MTMVFKSKKETEKNNELWDFFPRHRRTSLIERTSMCSEQLFNAIKVQSQILNTVCQHFIVGRLDLAHSLADVVNRKCILYLFILFIHHSIHLYYCKTPS